MYNAFLVFSFYIGSDTVLCDIVLEHTIIWIMN